MYTSKTHGNCQLTQDEFENLDHIPGVDPDFLTPYAFAKSPDESQPNDKNLVPLVAEPSPSTVVESSQSSSLPPTTSTESSQQMIDNSSFMINSKYVYIYIHTVLVTPPHSMAGPCRKK